ncbi:MULTISPECIES: MYXO-CTERM sorting domain-containing protein [unclassified Synechococcus]
MEGDQPSSGESHTGGTPSWPWALAGPAAWLGGRRRSGPAARPA